MSDILRTQEVASPSVTKKEIVRKIGRPPILTEAILRRLEAALSSGFNVSFACDYAGISTSTFYEYKAQDKEFSYRVNTAEQWATLRARQVILKAIDDGNVEAAKWYISRKCRVEFAPPTPM